MGISKQDLKSLIQGGSEQDSYQDLHWEGSFGDYLDLVAEKPFVIRNSFQRMYDLIMSYGYSESSDGKETLRQYHFFDDPLGKGRDAVFGLTRPLMNMVNHLKSAAHGFGVERRVLLLHGPVGSSKSTIVRMMKKGLEHYSRTPEGALYTYGWKLDDGEVVMSPMFQEPLLLLPQEMRDRIAAELNKSAEIEYPLKVEGVLNPFCRYYFNHFMEKSGGDIERVLENVVVRRLIISEKDRVGIGTFQPKDEKNQDSTELTGDINYRKIAVVRFGFRSSRFQLRRRIQYRESRPGGVHRSPEARCRVPIRLCSELRKNTSHQTQEVRRRRDIDEVIIGHTNEPEYPTSSDQRVHGGVSEIGRSVKIDIPYIT